MFVCFEIHVTAALKCFTTFYHRQCVNWKYYWNIFYCVALFQFGTLEICKIRKIIDDGECTGRKKNYSLCANRLNNFQLWNINDCWYTRTCYCIWHKTWNKRKNGSFIRINRKIESQTARKMRPANRKNKKYTSSTREITSIEKQIEENWRKVFFPKGTFIDTFNNKWKNPLFSHRFASRACEFKSVLNVFFHSHRFLLREVKHHREIA